jgi:hypothetical protein
MGKRDEATPSTQVIGVLGTPCRELGAQRFNQYLRQYSTPVLLPFSTPHDQLSAFEVDVLDPKLQGLEQPHAGAVKQRRHQTRRTVQAREHRARLVAGEDDGNMCRPLGMDEVSQPLELSAQHLLILSRDPPTCLEIHQRVPGRVGQLLLPFAGARRAFTTFTRSELGDEVPDL